MHPCMYITFISLLLHYVIFQINSSPNLRSHSVRGVINIPALITPIEPQIMHQLITPIDALMPEFPATENTYDNITSLPRVAGILHPYQLMSLLSHAHPLPLIHL